MSKEHGPGMFGKRVDVESPRADEALTFYAVEGIAEKRAGLLRETNEMSAGERLEFEKAVEIVDTFVFSHFAERLPKIPDSQVRTSAVMSGAISLNEIIVLPEIQKAGEGAKLAFIHVTVHELLHFYSARRRFVGKGNFVDQVGVLTQSATGLQGVWFKGMNEALISSLEHRLFYDFALGDQSGVSEDMKQKLRADRERALNQSDLDPIGHLIDVEVYPWINEIGDVSISHSYFPERVFLRLLIEKVAESSGRTIEAVREEFDRVALYGWDAQAKKDIIKAVGSDVWRALAWMKPEEFILPDRLSSYGYSALFRQIVSGDLEEAQKNARAIVKEKQHPNEAWHRAAAKDWQDEDIFRDDGF